MNKLERVAVSVANAAIGAVRGIVHHVKLIIVVTLFGMCLVTLRVVLLRMLPTAQMHIKAIRDIIDTFILVFDAIEDIILAIVAVIRAIVHLFHPKRPLHPTHFVKYHNVSIAEVTMYITTMATVCPELDTGYKISQSILQHVTATNLCPLTRAMSVTDAGPFINDTIGWMLFDTDPYSTTSCVSPEPAAEWVCIGIGSGLIIIEILLPLLLALIVLPHLVMPLVEVQKAVTHFIRLS